MNTIEGKTAGEWFNIGCRAKSLEEKIRAYSNAIQLKPNYMEAYNNRGIAYKIRKEYDLAIKDFTEAIVLNFDYEQSYFNRGNVYKHKKQYDIAINDYTKAIELKPDYIKAYNNRAVAYLHKNAIEQSIKDCSMAIALDPNCAYAYTNRGHAYTIKKQYDDAMNDFNKSIELKPSCAITYLNRGNVYKDKEQYALAIKEFNKAIEINPDCADAYDFRGFVYEKLNKWKEAIADYKKVLSFGIDGNGKTKNGKLKVDYEILIKNAEPKAKAQEKAEAEEKKLTAEYNASKLTRRFDRATLKYLHVHDDNNVLCQIPEWAERIVSNTATVDDDWINTIKVGKNVAVIEDNAFKGCPNLEWADFSEAAALRIIEKNAFAKCNKLVRVRIPKDCKLKRGAFPKKCKIEKVNVKAAIQPIYADITPIEKGKLADEYNASKLTKRFDRSVLRYLHFYDDCKTICQIPEWIECIASNTGTAEDSWIKMIKIGKNVAVIENDAFRDCANLEWVDFSEAAALKTIEKNAFSECSKLVRVRLPMNCRPKRGAFPKKCKVEKINVKANIQPISADAMPTIPVVSSTTIENIGFTDLNENVFGGDTVGDAAAIWGRQHYMQPSVLFAPICDTTVIGGKTNYTKPSMLTAPLNDTTIKGGYGDSIL